MSVPTCAAVCLASTLTATSATMATPTETELWRASVEATCIATCERRKRRDAEDQVADLQQDLALARSLTSSVAAPVEPQPSSGWSGLEVLGAGAIGLVIGALVTAGVVVYMGASTE